MFGVGKEVGVGNSVPEARFALRGEVWGGEGGGGRGDGEKICARLGEEFEVGCYEVVLATYGVAEGSNAGGVVGVGLDYGKQVD